MRQKNVENLLPAKLLKRNYVCKLGAERRGDEGFLQLLLKGGGGGWGLRPAGGEPPA